MNNSFNKETLCFYLVAISAALSAIAAICAAAFWRATGGLAVGFALLLPAVVLACLGYSYPSPLNKVRCGMLMGNIIVLPILYLCLFVATDLAGARVVLRTVAGVFQPNAMGVLLVVMSVCGIVAATLTVVRVMMHAFGHSLTDAERKLLVQSRANAEEGQPERVAPRKVTAERLAKADQEVRMSRMSVVPASPEVYEQAPEAHIVPPEEVRRRMQRRREQYDSSQPLVQEASRNAFAEPTPERQSAESTPRPSVAESMPERQAHVVLSEEEQVAPQPQQVFVAESPEDESPEPSAPEAHTILPTREQVPEAVAQEDAVQEIIYAPGTDVDDAPVVEVELARGENLTNEDIRTESAVIRPRQKENRQDDDLYTDFAYSGDDDED